ncbi:hypothetical protein FGG08_007376 [Glutinoglossum americanum]|uniref:GTPase-activating protein GYP7 n=1 Tax=Glutinoglossum americanum TaxID=1670608 RepID=A0A9P8I1K2_9PEZI|nr:hypothetical protein FGG08_007376 [Glutinoglossum americanum]
MAEDSIEDEREIELSSICAIFPELAISPEDPFTASIVLPVSPVKHLAIIFPPLADGAPPTGLPTPPSSTGVDRNDGRAAEGDVQREGVGEIVRDIHHLSHLPPLSLQIKLPGGYPADEPPILDLSTSPPWLPEETLLRLQDDGKRLWEELGRDQVIFAYIDHLQQAAERAFDLFDSGGDDSTFEVAQDMKIALLDFDRKGKREEFERGTFECGCLQDFYNSCITEGDVSSVKCLAPDCGREGVKLATEQVDTPKKRKRRKKDDRTLSPSELLQIPLDQDIVKRYVDLKRKAELESDKTTVYCPRKWCQGAARTAKHHKRTGLDPGKDESDEESEEEGTSGNGQPSELPPPSERLAICSDCAYAFCVVCFRGWHGELTICRPSDPGQLSAEEKASEEYMKLHTTPCPTCAAPCQKTQGCNHMICFKCNTHFCYLCSAWLDQANPYQHFNQEKSGCYQRLWELEGGDDGEIGLAYGGGVEQGDNAFIPWDVEEVGDESDESDGDDDDDSDGSIDEEEIVLFEDPHVQGELGQLLLQVGQFHEQDPPLPPPEAPAPPVVDGPARMRRAQAPRPVLPPGLRPEDHPRRAPPILGNIVRHAQGDRAGANRIGRPGLRRFLEMVENDEEDEWDSDELDDDEEHPDGDWEIPLSSKYLLLTHCFGFLHPEVFVACWTMTSSSVQYTPPASPPSPSASFYDLSDDEEGGYNTITHLSTGRGVKLLFSKSKVYVHPTPSAKDNIPGFVALVQQKPPPSSASDTGSNASPRDRVASSLLLAWLPEFSLGDAYSTYVKVDLAIDSDSPPRQSYLVPPPPTATTHSSAIGTYAFAVPVSEIYSLLVRPPSIGWWFGSVVINTRAGDSFPALFFHDSECQSTILQKKKRARDSFDPFSEEGGLFWGGDEVLRWLRKYVKIERSGAEPSIYLVEPSQEDREGFGKPVTVGFPNGGRQRSGSRAEEQIGRPSSSGGSGSGVPSQRDAGMDPITKALKEARWSFLEKLSKVTNFTRRTAQDVLDNPKIPPQVRRLMRNPEVQTLQDEFDSARLYLARWAMGIAEQSERERNQRIWTAKDVLEMEDSAVGEFEILDIEAGNMSLSERRKPVTLSEWRGFFDPHTGRLHITPDEVKERIFHGGLDPSDGVRKEAWMFLLGVYEWESSTAERKANMASRRDEYVRLKGAWWDRLADGGGEGEQGEWWREQKSRIEKDVHRTDRHIALFAGEDIPHPDPDSPFAEVGTNVHLEQMKDMLLTYNEYNHGLGYVQGMSDLLAPIYAVMQDDAAAFWGFVGFMERMERNFLRDQSGMRAQLLTLDHLVQLMDPALYLHLQSAESTNFFFFFRMLLVWYKREFELPDVLRLWECLWTDWLSSSFHLFIALAILEKHRNVLIDHLKYFDEVLKYINELSNTIDLQSTLIRAEALFRRFQRTVEAIDKKSNFPPPRTVRQRKSLTEPLPRVGSSATGEPSGSSSGSDAAATSGGLVGNTEKVISPELRQLLGREVIKMDNATELRDKSKGKARANAPVPT